MVLQNDPGALAIESATRDPNSRMPNDNLQDHAGGVAVVPDLVLE